MKFSITILLGAILLLTSCARSPYEPRIQELQPLEFHVGSPWTKARLNGVEGYFLIDTGATHTVLAERYAQEAGVIIGRPDQITTTSGTASVRQARFRDLNVGGINIAEGNAFVHDLNNIVAPRNDRMGGILGMDVLANYSMIFDNQRGIFFLNSGRLPVPPNHQEHPIFLDGGIPKIPLRMDGIDSTWWVRLDTGSGFANESRIYLDVSRTFASQILPENELGSPASFVSLNSVSSTDDLPVFPFIPISMLGLDLEDVFLVVHPDGRGIFSDTTTMQVNASILLRFQRVVIDTPSRRLYTLENSP